VAVLRIVFNISTSSVDEVRQFYERLLDLHVIMDHGWLVTLSSGEEAVTQVGIASEGGSGTPVPDLSIEVSDVDAVYRRAKDLGLDIAYDLTDEPWGVRRFYLLDPAAVVVKLLVACECIQAARLRLFSAEDISAGFLSGFRCTTSIRDQFRRGPDQRWGARARAAS